MTSVESLVDEQRVGSRQLILVVVILLATVLDGLDMQIIALLAPALLKEWGVPKAAFGPAIGASMAGLAIGAALGGKISDRFGRKTALCASLMLAGGATIGCAFTHNVFQLSLLRALCGLGAGACIPAAAALAAELMPRRWRSQTMAVITIGVPLGGMVSATLALTVLPRWGWQGAFAVAGILPIAVVILALFILPESPAWLTHIGRPADRVRAALRRLWPSIEFSGSLAAADRPIGAPAAKLFTTVNRRTNLGVFLAFLANVMALGGYLSWGPVMLTGIGYSLAEAAGVIFSINLAAVVAALTVSFVVARLGTRTLLLASTGIAAIATAAMGIAAAPHFGNSGIASGVVIAGGCLMINQTLLYVIGTHAYPVATRATALGIGTSLGRAGSILASLTFGALLGLPTPTWYFLAIFSGTLAVGCGCLIIDRHVTPSRAPQAS